MTSWCPLTNGENVVSDGEWIVVGLLGLDFMDLIQHVFTANSTGTAHVMGEPKGVFF